MKTIKEIFDNLKEEQKRQLRYAFDQNIPQYVEYEPGKYLGVHTSNNKKLSIASCAGSFYAGDIVIPEKDMK